MLFFVASCMLNVTASCKLNSICAQTVAGSWYGKADVATLSGNSNNYLTELVLKQKGNEVEGIFGYYFKDSYQSFFIRGKFNPKSRLVEFKNLPMLFYGAETRNGVECPMNFAGTLMVSRLNSSLRGSFYPEAQYKYTCPELRVNMIMDPVEKNQDSLLGHIAPGRKFWKPQTEDFVVNIAGRSDMETAIKDTSVKDVVPAEEVASSSPLAMQDSKTISIPEETEERLVKNFEARKNIYDQDILVASDSILVQFYDNGEVGGDSINVFINKKPVLINQLLTSRALNVYVVLDTLSEISELTMFAVNLGKYPPNTALMVITDGLYKREVYLSASLTQNASVRLRRLKKNK